MLEAAATKTDGPLRTSEQDLQALASQPMQERPMKRLQFRDDRERDTYTYVYMYIYIHVQICVYIYMYIYIFLVLYSTPDVYICIHICRTVYVRGGGFQGCQSCLQGPLRPHKHKDPTFWLQGPI